MNDAGLCTVASVVVMYALIIPKLPQQLTTTCGWSLVLSLLMSLRQDHAMGSR